MSTKKLPSYTNFIQTIMVGLIGWMAYTIHGLDARFTGVDKEIEFNKMEHYSFSQKDIEMSADIRCNSTKIADIDKRVLTNTINIEAIRNDQKDIKVVTEEQQ